MKSMLCRSATEVNPSSVDLATLQELPMEVQQEVASAMAQARKFPATRPGFEPMQKQPEDDRADALAPSEPAEAPEDVKEAWSRIAEALIHAAGLDDSDAGRDFFKCLVG